MLRNVQPVQKLALNGIAYARIPRNAMSPGRIWENTVAPVGPGSGVAVNWLVPIGLFAYMRVTFGMGRPSRNIWTSTPTPYSLGTVGKTSFSTLGFCQFPSTAY